MKHAIVLVFLVPLIGGVLTCLPKGKLQHALGLLTAFGTAAAVALLGRQLTASGAQSYWLGGWSAPLGINLHADGLSLLMLLLTAVVGICVSIYAINYFADANEGPQSEGFFWPLWLLLWGGLNCLFVAGDVFTIYLLLEATLLASVALAALGGSHAAHVSALRYLLAATVAGLFYLLGVTLLYSETRTLDLWLLRDLAPTGPITVLALGLMLVALLLKTALFPLHFWLPAAHSTAPAPVSAVLSALVVKASFYVIFRLWYQIAPGAAPHGIAYVLAGLGAIAIVWGSWQAIRQPRLKMLVAYSTVAQIGYLFLLFPLAASHGGKVMPATVYHMLSHGLAKAAMFMGAGALLKCAHSDLLSHTRGTARQAPFAVAALILSGAALTGLLPGFGAKGKLLEIAREAHHGWAIAIIIVGMILAGVYTYVGVRESFRPADRAQSQPPPVRVRGLECTALALAVAAILLSFNADAVLSLWAIASP